MNRYGQVSSNAQHKWYLKNRDTVRKQCHENYLENRDKILAKHKTPEGIIRSRKSANQHTLNKRKLINSYRTKCISCNMTDKRCLDFHHCDPKETDQIVNTSLSSKKKIIEEIEKCIILCANCHRIKHRTGKFVINNKSNYIK